MVRAPTIRGRPTPARKHKAGGSSPSGPVTLTARAAVPKALKRAEKRAQLLAKTSDAEENMRARALLKEGEHSISKSSLRRRKRKARDEIGKNVEEGRWGGVSELKDAVEDLEMELKEGDGIDEDGPRANNVQAGVAMAQGGKVTASQRKRVLAQEQARQSVILSDPTYKASPFEALRIHARNTIAAWSSRR